LSGVLIIDDKTKRDKGGREKIGNEVFNRLLFSETYFQVPSIEMDQISQEVNNQNTLLLAVSDVDFYRQPVSVEISVYSE
jgi:hypothetical protein